MQDAAISCLGITSLYDHFYCGLDILQVCSWFFPGYILDGGCHFGLSVMTLVLVIFFWGLSEGERIAVRQKMDTLLQNKRC